MRVFPTVEDEKMCFCYQFSDERDSRARPGAGLGREGGGTTHSSLSQLQFVFSSWTTILFRVVHLICIHLFPAKEAFSSLRRSLTISQNPAASSHYLLRNENTAWRRGGKERKEKKKERGRKQKGGGRKATRSSVQNKRGGLV